MRLLKVIKNPVTNHLPTGCRKIGMSFSATNVKHPKDIVPADEPIAIIVGAMAHGQVIITEKKGNKNYIKNTIFFILFLDKS